MAPTVHGRSRNAHRRVARGRRRGVQLGVEERQQRGLIERPLDRSGHSGLEESHHRKRCPLRIRHGADTAIHRGAEKRSIHGDHLTVAGLECAEPEVAMFAQLTEGNLAVVRTIEQCVDRRGLEDDVRLSLRMQVLLAQRLDVKCLDEAFVYRHAVVDEVLDRDFCARRDQRKVQPWPANGMSVATTEGHAAEQGSVGEDRRSIIRASAAQSVAQQRGSVLELAPVDIGKPRRSGAFSQARSRTRTDDPFLTMAAGGLRLFAAVNWLGASWWSSSHLALDVCGCFGVSCCPSVAQLGSSYR